MKLYIEEELVALGFERNFIPPEQNDGKNSYVYYTFNFDHHTLISDVFEDGKEEAVVTFFDGGQPLSKEFVNAVVIEFKK